MWIICCGLHSTWSQPSWTPLGDFKMWHFMLDVSFICHPSIFSGDLRATELRRMCLFYYWSSSCTFHHTHFSLSLIQPLTGPFDFWETHNKKHRMSLMKQHTQWYEISNGENKLKYQPQIRVKPEWIFTGGPWVKLCVQSLQRMHQLLLWAGCGLCWTCWTHHFLFFFVLHLRIDVEAWDLPWGKIYSEAKG